MFYHIFRLHIYDRKGGNYRGVKTLEIKKSSIFFRNFLKTFYSHIVRLLNFEICYSFPNCFEKTFIFPIAMNKSIVFI